MRRKRFAGEQPSLFDTTVPGVKVERYVCRFCGPPAGRRFFTLRGLRIHRARMHKDRLPAQNSLPLA